MELKALGKINLGLDVLGRRENGYHDVRMVMQTVYLYDQIRIEKTKKPGIELSTNLFYLPVNENNLAYQAADLLMKEFDVKEGVKITLDKHIPVAAGMAGGSSNAAAVLFGINRMFSLGLSQKELMERGVTLGADVPYCVMRGTVLAEGIGEILTPLPACPKCHVLIAKPPIRYPFGSGGNLVHTSLYTPSARSLSISCSIKFLETVVSSPMVSSLGFNYTLCSLSYHKKYDETREDTLFYPNYL